MHEDDTLLRPYLRLGVTQFLTDNKSLVLSTRAQHMLDRVRVAEH